jgi:hypothetical protein
MIDERLKSINCTLAKNKKGGIFSRNRDRNRGRNRLQKFYNFTTTLN